MKGREPSTTNNRMELTAAIVGLNALRPEAVVTMHGDSRYVVQGHHLMAPGVEGQGVEGQGVEGQGVEGSRWEAGGER